MTDRAEQALQRGVQALQQQRLEEAQIHFREAAAHPDVAADAYVGLAYAHAQSGHWSACAEAAEQALRHRPQHLRALLARAEAFHRLGDDQAALSFDRAALKLAAQQPEALQGLQPLLQQAQQRCAAHEQRMARAIEKVQAGALRTHGAALSRFGESVDMLLGHQPEYRQEPLQYRFPGLASVPFYPREAFPWLDALEAATDAIAAEAQALLEEGHWFAPYIQPDPRQAVLNQGQLYNNGQWGACFLMQNGQARPEVLARCPHTWAAVQQLPLVQVPGRSPSVLFSRLQPHTHIPAHHGFFNTRLIGHLPLVVPHGCRFRVGAQVRPWVRGQAWVFDDTIEHEAWNDSDHDRLILLFEVWQPALSPAEREAVGRLFQALDAVNGPAPSDRL